MKNPNFNWFDSITRKLDFSRLGVSHRDEDFFLELRNRTRIVVKTRWVLLVLLGIYGLFAGCFFYFSTYGFFLTNAQLVCLIMAVAGVFTYNFLLGSYNETLSRVSWVRYGQILLDILFATVLVQLSGGAASWFWPVYLIVTIEASFLLERKRDVLLVGSIGTILYVTAITGTYTGFLPHVTMPFVDDNLHKDVVYLILMSCWVSILNVVVGFISCYLMSVIRRETEALRESEEQLTTFLDTANDLVFSITPAGQFLYVNHAWKQTLGLTLEDLSNCTFSDLLHKESREECLREMERVVAGDRVPAIESKLVSRAGNVVTVEGNLTCGFKDDQAVAVWGIFRDVTERQRAQEQLYHLAHHDSLTGLPNRILLVDRMRQAKALSNRLKHMMGTLFIDLDRFKIINDTLGHEVGDKLLQSAARRLTGCVREVDTVARIGGDEFVIVLVNLASVKDAEKIAQKIIKTLAQPYYIDSHELFITASIGIAFYPGDSDDVEMLVKKADIAMYSAKGQGRNVFKLYDLSMDENTAKLLSLATGMRKALDREEFTLSYQPKVDIISGKITALEALLRWDHPELGQLPPVEFINLAEETGLIIPLGEWVLRTACRQNKQWQGEGLPPIRVAVNLSGYQLQQKNIVDVVKRTLEENELSAEYLELEVTETVIMQNPDFAVSVLGELRDLGIHISIDDFGTGYSSLAHLKRFSVNTLKIDKSFVRDVEINSTDAAIATAIIAMGNSLNLQVIAEGVETEGQLSFLRENLCDEMQGYYFSKPLPADGVADLLRTTGGRAWIPNSVLTGSDRPQSG